MLTEGWNGLSWDYKPTFSPFFRLGHLWPYPRPTKASSLPSKAFPGGFVLAVLVWSLDAGVEIVWWIVPLSHFPLPSPFSFLSPFSLRLQV